MMAKQCERAKERERGRSNLQSPRTLCSYCTDTQLLACMSVCSCVHLFLAARRMQLHAFFEIGSDETLKCQSGEKKTANQRGAKGFLGWEDTS